MVHAGGDGAVRVASSVREASHTHKPPMHATLTWLPMDARINLGVHYPSDAIIGGLVGLLYCFIGTGIYKLVVSGCGSCSHPTNACYGKPHIAGQGKPSVGILGSKNIEESKRTH